MEDKIKTLKNDAFEEAVTQDQLDEAQDAIKMGERTRIIYELLLEQIECTYENTFNEVITKLKSTQDAYNEGVKYIETLIKTTPKK